MRRRSPYPRQEGHNLNSVSQVAEQSQEGDARKRRDEWRCPLTTSTSERQKHPTAPGAGPGVEQSPLFEEGELTPKSHSLTPSYKGTGLAGGVQ